jgi:hypothetical protein
MEIKKLVQFLNEAKIYLPIVDIVIDNDGNIYDGKTVNDGDVKHRKLIKGGVDWKSVDNPSYEPGLPKTISKVVKILGSNGIRYPAGIDKNGNLLSINSDDTYALNDNGEKIKIPNKLTKILKIKYWKKDYDYSSLLPIVGTGWVNVKIDMEIVKRVRRYSTGLGNNRPGFDNFLFKISEFQELSKAKREQKYIKRIKKNKIQREMSVIVLLHHLNEIKDFFTPSQSGFLFESFIAGLIPNAKVNDDNSSADVVAGNDQYQIKLYKESSGITVTQANGRLLDYYIIGIKHIDRIEIITINSRDIQNDIIIAQEEKKIITKGGGAIDEETGKIIRKAIPCFSLPNLRKEAKQTQNNTVKIFNIDLNNIEERILNLGEDLKMAIEYLYDEISSFQYNIEALITGRDQNGKRADFDKHYDDAGKNVTNLKTYLDDIKTNINKNENPNN